MNVIRFGVITLVICLGWNTLAAGMKVAKAMDNRVASQLELLAEN